MALSSAELSGWMAYAKIEPFGDQRADLRSGHIAALLFNIHRGQARARRPDDFLVRWAEPEAPQSTSAMMDTMQAIAAANNPRFEDAT